MPLPLLTTVPRKDAHTSIQNTTIRIIRITLNDSKDILITMKRCDYSYASSSYECTCPPGLTLGPDGKDCQGGAEVKVITADWSFPLPAQWPWSGSSSSSSKLSYSRWRSSCCRWTACGRRGPTGRNARQSAGRERWWGRGRLSSQLRMEVRHW